MKKSVVMTLMKTMKTDCWPAELSGCKKKPLEAYECMYPDFVAFAGEESEHRREGLAPRPCKREKRWMVKAL